jgi:hypothetical protein
MRLTFSWRSGAPKVKRTATYDVRNIYNNDPVVDNSEKSKKP